MVSKGNLAEELLTEIQRDNPNTDFEKPIDLSIPESIDSELRGIQQKFMHILQNDKYLQHKYSDHNILDSILKNKSQMLDIIHEYSSVKKRSKTHILEDRDDSETDDYDEEYEDNGDYFSYIFKQIKECLIITILFALLTQPYVKNFLTSYFTILQNSIVFYNITISVVFFILVLFAKTLLFTFS